MYIDYNKILRCVNDPKIFRACCERITYCTLAIPPIGTKFVCEGMQKVTTETRPVLVYGAANSVQNLTYAELCAEYHLCGKPITVTALVRGCTWNTVSGHLDAETVWGTVYTCDDIQIHTKTQGYLVMHLPVGFETRYSPCNTVGHVDVAVKSDAAVSTYFLCPIIDEMPDTTHITQIDTLQYHSKFICNVAEDVDYTVRCLTTE